jgi:hypothetical protein
MLVSVLHVNASEIRNNPLTRQYSLRTLRVRRQIVEEKTNAREPLGPIAIRISIVRLPATPWQEKQSVGEAILGGWEDIGLIPRLEDVPSSEALFLLFIRYRGEVAAVRFFS